MWGGGEIDSLLKDEEGKEEDFLFQKPQQSLNLRCLQGNGRWLFFSLHKKTEQLLYL